jgi:hypothetical protein
MESKITIRPGLSNPWLASQKWLFGFEKFQPFLPDWLFGP